MRFYIVGEDEKARTDNKVIERMMCDNKECKLYESRSGFDPKDAIISRVHTMEYRHFCSWACRNQVEQDEAGIYDDARHV